MKNIKETSVKGLKWTGLSEILSRSVQPLVTIILARILSPEDFGLIAVANIVISLCLIFQDFGFKKAIVQTENNYLIYANNAFWLNLMFSLFLYITIYIFAPLIATLFKSASSVSIIRVLSFKIVIISLSSVQLALIQRSIKFKLIFIIQFSNSSIIGLASILLAIYGFGVWSIVIGTLSGSIVQFFLCWIVFNWKPKLDFDIGAAKEMLHFSKWVAAEGIAAWLITWGDSIILGSFLGLNDLGIYRIGTFFVMFLSNIFFTPLVSVAYSFFSRLQSDIREFNNYFLKLSKIVTAIVLPVAIIVALLSEPIVNILLGDKWRGAEIVIATMSIRWALGCIVGLNSIGFTAIGRPDINFKLLAIVSSFTIPTYIIAAPYGLVVFCFVRLLVEQLDNIINYIFSVKVLQLPSVYILTNIKTTLPSITIMIFVTFFIINNLAITNLLMLILSGCIGFSTYILSLWVFQKKFLKWSIKYALHMLR